MDAPGSVVNARFESRVLRGNPLGDPVARDLMVYLPPGYEADTGRRYPVLYCLAGFTGRGRTLLNVQPFSPNLGERLDRLVSRGEAREMILVMPDCFTRLGGSQYINSTATGRYEDYLIDEVIPLVDSRFRTLPESGGRAVVGKSSGGYGALVNAMRHADVFSIAASHSGDCYFEYCYLPEFPKAWRVMKGGPGDFLDRFWQREKKGRDEVPALNLLAMSACYSPDPESPEGFRLPFDPSTGTIVGPVWRKWLEHDPVRMVPDYVEALRRLKLLYFDAGTRDEYGLDCGARALAAALSHQGIAFVHEEFDDGHFNTSYRYDRSLALVSRTFDER